ncbi:MAG TPA: hypothetical protein VIH76_01475 [Candidatus Acidoferrales bacterium]
MSDRQYAAPLVIRGLTEERSSGETSRLRRIRLQGNEKGSYPQFSEEWFQELLYRFPSLLPAAEVEPAFESLEAVAKELPVAGKYVDLLFVNADGCIALVETKLMRNPEARREVIAQAIDYACEMSGWTYAQLAQAVKKASKSSEEDPLLHIVRRDAEGSFNENEFIENITRNLRKGRFLLLVVGDDVSAEAERMADYIQRTPHLHFTLGLVELALFHEKEGNIDPLFIQPRIVAKTELQPRIVIEIALADGLQMKSQIRQESPTPATRSTISVESFFEQLKKTSLRASEVAEWALERAAEHQLTIDWGAVGPSLKYFEESSVAAFNFGQLRKDGGLSTSHLLPKFVKLGLPTDIAVSYLDDIIGLVPGSYRKDFPYEHDIRTQVVLYGKDGDWLPLEKLAPGKEQWFEAIDKAIQGIRKVRDES